MMPLVILVRSYRMDCTIGVLTLPADGDLEGKQLYTLERPWLNNKPNISCIPPGFYAVKYLEKSASGRYRRCWHVQEVSGRSGILIHAGNYVEDTLGCILPGTSQNGSAVYNSRSAMEIMRSRLQDFYLLIS